MISLSPDFDFSSLQDEAAKIDNAFAEADSKVKNPFPIKVFPMVVQEIIEATNQHLNFPIDYIAGSILAATSLSIGNTHRVVVKQGHIESPIVYLALVGKAGTNKSHPLSFAFNPIVEQDKISYRQYEKEKQEYDVLVNLSKKEREQNGLNEPIKPFWSKYLLSDYTPEALAEVHRNKKRGIGIYVDELAGWFKNFNRYNKGSETETWLSAWSGKPITIDRKSSEPIYIPQPYIMVVGTIQNGLIHELAKDSRTQNGFMDRILFVNPDNVLKPYWSESNVNQEIIDSWHKILIKILNLPLILDQTQNPKANLLHFSPEAKQIMYQWQRQNTDECNKAENDAIKSIFSKMDIYAVRLALNLEMLYWACNDSDKQAISTKAVTGAIQLVEYFKKSAIKVHTILSETSPFDNLPLDKQVIYESLPEVFTTETGVEVAKRLGMAERTFKRLLSDKALFKHLSRGEYERLF